MWGTMEYDGVGGREEDFGELKGKMGFENNVDGGREKEDGYRYSGCGRRVMLMTGMV